MDDAPVQRSQVVNRGFSAWIVFSLLIHGGVVGGVVYAQSLRPPKIKLSDSIPVELVQLGEQRDPRLLPRKAPPPPPPAEPPATEVEPPAEPAPPVAPPPPPPAAVALETQNTPPPKPDKPKKEKPKPSKRKPRLSRAAQQLLNSGASSEGQLDDVLARLEKREGSPDGHRSGTTTDPAKALQGYGAAVKAAMQEAYAIPAAIPSAQRRFLKATVVLYIDRRGRITKYNFAERHSNQLFMSALEKLLKTIKLPAPPASLRRRMATEGIDVIFSLSS